MKSFLFVGLVWRRDESGQMKGPETALIKKVQHRLALLKVFRNTDTKLELTFQKSSVQSLTMYQDHVGGLPVSLMDIYINMLPHQGTRHD